MKQTKAALTPRELKERAVARVLARRVTPKFTEYPDLRGGVVRVQADSRIEFAPPADLDQWVDYAQSRCGYGKPAADTLLELLELLRGGPGTVPGAVRFAADRLRSPHEQFAVWAALSAAPSGPSPVDVVKARIAREWQAAGLAITPGPAIQVEPLERHTVRPSRVDYRTAHGQNAA